MSHIKAYRYVLLALGATFAVLFGTALATLWPSPAAEAVEIHTPEPPVVEGRTVTNAAPLPRDINDLIRAQIARMTKGSGRTTTLRALERSEPMREHAEQVFAAYGLPPELIWLAHVESHWRNSAVSPAAAAGVWQFIPKTAVRFGLKVEESADDRFDYEKQTVAAARYLRFLHDYYDGNWPIAIASYNCGEERMDRAIAANGGKADFWELVEKQLLPKETRDYVPKVLAASHIGTDPSHLEVNGSAAKSQVASKPAKPRNADSVEASTAD